MFAPRHACQVFFFFNYFTAGLYISGIGGISMIPEVYICSNIVDWTAQCQAILRTGTV
jgi:hypothetical protein